MAAPDGRHPSALGAFPALRRLRDRARAGWPLVGAGRPHAGPLGRGLRAGEPRGHDPRLRRALRPVERPSPRRVLPRLPRHAERVAGRCFGALGIQGRHPDARSDDRHLLRACLHRPLPRPAAARRRRPDGRARGGDGAHRLGTGPHRRALAQAGRGLGRSAGTERGLLYRHARPDVRPARRDT